MSDIKTVMVTTDLSDTAKKAFPLAQRFADAFEAKLVVLFVQESVPPLVVEYTAVNVDELTRMQSAWTSETLSAFVEEQLGSTEGVTIETAVGTPHEEIVRRAKAIRADLVVMATHGRGFISHAILGSTTERVVRHAPCPVLVVRDNQDED